MFLLRYTCSAIALCVLVLLPLAAQAQSAPATTLGNATSIQTAPVQSPGASGLINPLGTASVPQAIGRAIAWLGGLAGSLFFGMLLWGGIQWMTAGGDAGKVKSGQGRIVASVSGIVIVLLAYMIVATLIGLLPQ